MSDKTTTAITTFGAFVVFAALIGAIYSLGSQMITAFAGLDAKFGATLAAAAGTVVVSVISVVVSRYLEARAVIRQELRQKKIPVYEDLLSFMFKLFMGTKLGDPPKEADLLKFMADFNQRAMVWASDDVLNAWIAFRGASIDAAESSDATATSLMFKYEALIEAIRKDLGHKNKGLAQGKLLSLFVNDIDKYIDTPKAS